MPPMISFAPSRTLAFPSHHLAGNPMSFGNILPPFLFIFFQRMTADVHTQHFFFKCKLRSFLVFSYIRKLTSNSFFCSSSTISNRDICPLMEYFCLLCHLIQDLYINDHKLLSGSRRLSNAPDLIKFSIVTFIDFLSDKTFQKILQITKRAMHLFVLDDRSITGFPIPLIAASP